MGFHVWFLYLCAGGVAFVALQYAFICARWYIPLVRDLLPIRLEQVWGKVSCVYVLGREAFPGGVLDHRFERLLMHAEELSRYYSAPIVLCGGAYEFGDVSYAACARKFLLSLNTPNGKDRKVVTPENPHQDFPVGTASNMADEVMQIWRMKSGRIVLVYEEPQKPKVEFLLWAHGLTYACSRESVKVHGGVMTHRTIMVLSMLDPLNLVMWYIMRPFKIVLCKLRGTLQNHNR